MHRGDWEARRRGFTLIEMLILIVMISILATLAFPRLDYMRYRVNADARNVMTSLSYAQRLAVSLQHNVLVTFNATTRMMQTLEDKNDDGSYSIDERRRNFQLDVGVIFSRNGAPALPAPESNNEVTQLTFWRDGSASAAGVVFLNTGRGVANGNNKDARAISITRATGRPAWFTYTGGTWRQGI